MMALGFGLAVIVALFTMCIVVVSSIEDDRADRVDSGDDE